MLDDVHPQRRHSNKQRDDRENHSLAEENGLSTERTRILVKMLPEIDDISTRRDISTRGDISTREAANRTEQLQAEYPLGW